MKKLLILLALIIPLSGIGQVSVTKVGDMIKFSGLGIGNGSVSSSIISSEIYSNSIDQVLIQGTNIIFANSAGKTIIASIQFSKIANKLGQLSARLYIEHLIADGYFDKSITISDEPLAVQPDTTKVEVITPIAMQDGTDPAKKATVATRGSTTSINTTIIGSDGSVISSFGGADIDKGAFAVGTDKGTVIEGVYSTDMVTAGKKAAVSIMADRALRTYETSPMNFQNITHTSPVNGTCVFTTDSTLTASLFPFTVDCTTCFIASITIEKADATVVKYENARNGVSITSSNNVIRIKGVKPFLVGDLMYRVAISAQPQGVSSTTGRSLTDVQNPDYYQRSNGTVFSGTNQSGTNYYPSASGLLLDDYRTISISGKIIEGDAVNDSLYLQVTNDETLTDWTSIQGYDWKTNTTISQYKQAGAGTLTFAWQFTNLNFKYFRVVCGFGDATNTVAIRYRKVY
jgi:hypothetical protein